MHYQLDAASTHNSAKTHADTSYVFVTGDLNLWPPK